MDKDYIKAGHWLATNYDRKDKTYCFDFVVDLLAEYAQKVLEDFCKEGTNKDVMDWLDEKCDHIESNLWSRKHCKTCLEKGLTILKVKHESERTP